MATNVRMDSHLCSTPPRHRELENHTKAAASTFLESVPRTCLYTVHTVCVYIGCTLRGQREGARNGPMIYRHIWFMYVLKYMLKGIVKLELKAVKSGINRQFLFEVPLHWEDRKNLSLLGPVLGGKKIFTGSWYQCLDVI